MTDFDSEKLAGALEGALPPAAILSFVEAIRRLSPERCREIARIIRGKPRWDEGFGERSYGLAGYYEPNGALTITHIEELLPPAGRPGSPGVVLMTEHPPCEMLARNHEFGAKPASARPRPFLIAEGEASAGFLASGRAKDLQSTMRKSADRLGDFLRRLR